jgi:hypothetical protein
MHDACVTRGIMLMKVILDFREVGLCEFSLMGNVSVITIAFFFFFWWRVLWGRFTGIGKVGGGPLLGVEANNVDYRKIMVLERYRALCAWSRCRDVGPLP